MASMDTTNSHETPRSLKPVVALDVDGVFRPFPKLSEDELEADPRFFERELMLTKDNYPTLFHGQPTWPESGELKVKLLFSSEARELVQKLHAKGFELVWATTWQHAANAYFAPVLGLPELPVAVVSDPPKSPGRFYGSSPEWKSHQLADAFPGRPLLWLDDNQPWRQSDRLESLRSSMERALTWGYEVDPSTGLTERDGELILEWLELSSSVEGQEALRERLEEQDELERARLAAKHEELKRARERRARVRQLLDEEGLPERLKIELVAAAATREGLTIESVGYALQRSRRELKEAGIDVDPHCLSARLREPGFHLLSSDE